MAPAILHVDEGREAVLTTFVPDRGLAAYYWNPSTRPEAPLRLGQMVRRIHGLPLPPGEAPRDPR